jgi:hypothetical protein
MSARHVLVLAAALATSTATTTGCIIVWPGPGYDDNDDCEGCDDVDEGSFDDDGDGLTNDEEDACGSDSDDASETCVDVIDSDGDGRTDGEELDRGTDPFNPDTDNDGDDDWAEQECNSSPLDPQFTCDGSDGGSDVDQEQGYQVCWWIGDWLALGQTCTFDSFNVHIEEMPAEGCVDVIGAASITCYSTDGNEACSTDVAEGDDVIVDESGCN